MTEGKVWGIGHREEVGYAIDRRVLDGDPGNIEYVDTTLDEGSNPSFKLGIKSAGRAVKPDFIPTRAQWGNSKVAPYDFFVLNGMTIVSDTVKNIVEGLEPNIHQFFPIEVVYKDGSFAKQMYFFNICARLDTADRERTTARLGRTWDPRTGEVIFSKKLIGNHHAWIDKHILHGMFFSDNLKSALEVANVTGIVFNRRKLS